MIIETRWIADMSVRELLDVQFQIAAELRARFPEAPGSDAEDD